MENASIKLICKAFLIESFFGFFDKKEVFFEIDEMSSEFEVINHFVHFAFAVFAIHNALELLFYFFIANTFSLKF